MPIGIGINENVFLKGIELDGANIIVKFEQLTDRVKPKSRFADIAGDELNETKDDIDLRIFPPLVPNKSDQTHEKKVELVESDIKRTKGILRHIMKAYLTDEDLKGVWADTFIGLPLTEESYEQKIVNKEILEGVNKNMARIAIEKLKPFFNDPSRLYRLLLVRQSKEKHFATFRNKFLDENPILESMEIPKDASKVQFTKYELNSGLDDATPIAKESADKKGGGNDSTGSQSQAPTEASSIFG